MSSVCQPISGFFKAMCNACALHLSICSPYHLYTMLHLTSVMFLQAEANISWRDTNSVLQRCGTAETGLFKLNNAQTRGRGSREWVIRTVFTLKLDIKTSAYEGKNQIGESCVQMIQIVVIQRSVMAKSTKRKTNTRNWTPSHHRKESNNPHPSENEKYKQ